MVAVCDLGDGTIGRTEELARYCLSINIQKLPAIDIQKFPVKRRHNLNFECFFALFESVRIITGFEDVAVVSNAIK